MVLKKRTRSRDVHTAGTPSMPIINGTV